MRKYLAVVLFCSLFQSAFASSHDQLRLLDLLGVSSFIQANSEREKTLLDTMEQDLEPEVVATALSVLDTEAFIKMLQIELQASSEKTQLEAYSQKLKHKRLNPQRLELIKQLIDVSQFLALLKAGGIGSLSETRLINFYLYSYRYTPSEEIKLQISRYMAAEVQAVLVVMGRSLQKALFK